MDAIKYTIQQKLSRLSQVDSFFHNIRFSSYESLSLSLSLSLSSYLCSLPLHHYTIVKFVSLFIQ
jgi:hypothetical protein